VKNSVIKKCLIVFVVASMFFSVNVAAVSVKKINSTDHNNIFDLYENKKLFSPSVRSEDLDPLVDLKVTVKIKEIRALDKIDEVGDPDFYVKVFINSEEFTSPIWYNKKYVKDDDCIWYATKDVPDDVENVSIKIQLWDWNPGLDVLCDLSENNERFPGTRDVDLVYNLKSGHWYGEDYIEFYPAWFDISGYGRVNGCDDNSIYQNDLDCELYFDICQNDFDGDGIPYWTEVNVYGTDPLVDDTGSDSDNDGVPIEWEYRWGHCFRWDWRTHSMKDFWFYNPFEWENHSSMDPDEDALNNVEEYLTSQWGSDPFRKDLFIELDQMEAGPNGEPASVLPEGSKELLRIAHHRRNIVYHLDDGCMGGGEMIPFIKFIPGWSPELLQVYNDYFLHGDEHNWRRAIFRYSVIVYDANFSGYMFLPNAFQLSSSWVDKNIVPTVLKGRDVVWASVYMHETGHLLNIQIPGGHDDNSKAIWQWGWWKWRPYKSCMNYGYTYFLVDYSDGSHGKKDHDDWDNLDFGFFKQEFI